MAPSASPPVVNIFDATDPVSEDDVRELKEFLHGSLTGDEAALHRLLERHPALVGVLGFSEFASEQPLYKLNESYEIILTDARQRDRADLIAAKKSIIQPPSGGGVYKSAHIIELKSAATKISERGYGLRLSPEARHAVEQLREYKHWLTRVPENRDLFRTLGWDIRVPQQYLVMGTSAEFASNPGHFDEIKARLQEDGVWLTTVDELLGIADSHVRTRRRVPDVTGWAISPHVVQGNGSLKVLVQVEDFALLYPTSVEFVRSAGPGLPSDVDYFSYDRGMRRAVLAHLRRDFMGLCAYCRTPDRLAGGIDAFSIETFRPRALFPQLAWSYQNLLYACRSCNAAKAAGWPAPREEQAGYRFVDPVERFHDHFEETDEGVWRPRTRAAEYTIANLKLNRESLMKTRRFLHQLQGTGE
ncbi:Shedu anti-phage system protein SduA domain-containing protein [Sorangium sp. So ce204]|uniref:Shedu anti-phage system protein SduA domain-containing protein n=1 Tax=Sorangium sp. So ce204 TaxID=3133288 RepID=UPI003F63CBE3